MNLVVFHTIKELLVGKRKQENKCRMKEIRRDPKIEIRQTFALPVPVIFILLYICYFLALEVMPILQIHESTSKCKINTANHNVLSSRFDILNYKYRLKRKPFPLAISLNLYIFSFLFPSFSKQKSLLQRERGGPF